MRKNIPLTLVDLLQPTIFEPITEEPHITDNAVITNMLESIERGILTPETSTLYIRISGDGRNVGRKVKHVMVTMTLLNDLNGLQKPDNNYTLVLYPGAESYESFKNALTPLISDLSILKEKGFDQIGGIKAANTQHFCPWCDCSKDEINTTTKTINKSMDEIKDNYNQIDGHIKKPLFYMIPLQNWLVRGMYQIQDVTPYIHVLVNQVAEFIEIHHEFGLTAFSCSAMEKKNHMQVCLYFQNTLKDGDTRIHENLQL
ncbi:hypothetical protein RhiirC2_853147 [Rhizophagus irregularis]|uniref:Uncharacterized protein n=1 Tax=Rhizophagus irregularis TaxID=588596 RepID=A0A2N1MWV0_9GLOM|nr:hypothetical protein RhiirC2_853147 [Rhizophagus irregularis]